MTAIDKHRILIVLAFLSVFFYGQIPDTLWTKTFGGVNRDQAYAILYTEDNKTILVGSTWSYGAGSSDIYLVSLDGSNTITRTYGGSQFEAANDIIEIDSGYIMLGGTTSYGSGAGDIYLVKIDDNYDTLWTRTYGGAGDDGECEIHRTYDGGYIIIGSTASYGAGDYDLYILKINALGDTAWTRTFGGAGWDGGLSVIETSDSGYIATGAISDAGPSEADLLIVKYDRNGNVQWSKRYGAAGSDEGTRIMNAYDGGYIICGDAGMNGTSDIWLLKIDTLGDTTWTRTYGGTNDEHGCGIIAMTNNRYLIIGSTLSYGSGLYDVYLVCTYINGGVVWSTTYGGSEHDIGIDGAMTIAGVYLIGGVTRSFGNGQDDFYLLAVYEQTGIESGGGKEKHILPNGNATILQAKDLSFSRRIQELYTIDGRRTDCRNVNQGIYFFRNPDGSFTKIVVVR